MPEHDLGLREERLRRLTASVPYALLAVSTGLTLATHGPLWPRHAETLGLAVVAAALMWTMTGLKPRWASRPGLMPAFVAALVVMIAVLSTRSVWFAGFFGFTGYIYSWQFLRGPWRLLGVAATAAVTITAYMGGPPDPTPSSVLLHLFFAAAVVVLVVVFSQLGEITEERSDERRRMVERLRETIRENEGLHAQLLVQAREAGVHDERERLAREIHDTLAQGFVGIITQLQAAQRAEARPGEESRAGAAEAVDGDRAEWRLRVANATRLARENLVEARRSVHALGPAPLAAAPLPDALADLTAEWSRLHGVRAEFTATGPARPLHGEVEAALLRTLQESLTNVSRHARADRVGVTLSYMEDLVALDVRDDGAGFETGPGWGASVSEPPGEPAGGPESTASACGDGPNGGFGLTSMRQRVTRLAGTLEIESEPGAGTAVSVTVPAFLKEDPGERSPRPRPGHR
ncbi:signal transduction histidine kinase [Nocardiopsis terrae]|uniref:Oxygen sensor histidine kinase NreB n=1 Tax=Nocardiopsis terrae TaxID=372655 RepID=A0ABR9HN55_9ACTN|nr:signal transduction histidine kinase [Nocardiopsis terrae]